MPLARGKKRPGKKTRGPRKTRSGVTSKKSARRNTVLVTGANPRKKRELSKTEWDKEKADSSAQVGRSD